MKISKEIKTGVVVLLALLGFYFLFNFLKGKNLFTSGNIYYAVYNNVDGLAPSKPVTVNGLRIGRVESIEIVDKQTPIYFVVKLSTTRDIPFSKNTVAEIYEPGLMSGTEVRLLLDYGKNRAENGDTIKGAIKESLTGMLSKEVSPIKNKIDSLMVSVDGALNSVQNLLDQENANSLKSILHNLDNTLKSFNHTANSLTQTANSANQLIAENQGSLKKTMNSADQMLVSTKNSVEKFGSVADKLNQLELEKTLQNFEETSEKLNAIMTKIDNGDGTLGAMMNDKELYNNLNETSKSLNNLMTDFKENPNRYVQFSIFGKKQKTTAID